jgi:hypothetical protein
MNDIVIIITKIIVNKIKGEMYALKIPGRSVSIVRNPRAMNNVSKKMSTSIL